MEIKKGATDQTIYFEILDSTSTTGGRKTGLAFDTASLVASYVRTRGTRTAITLATLAAADSAHSDGGFKEVDATNMPGIYRLDLPDAAVATGAEEVVVTLKGASGMGQVSRTISLVDNSAKDIFDRIGAPAGASASADIAAIKSQTAAIETDTQDIQGRLPAALVSGRIDASVGAMAANVLTATAIATDAITAAKIAPDAIGASELAADAASEIATAVWAATTRLLTAGTNIVLAKGTGVTGFNDLDAAGVRSAVGLASANLDIQLSAIDTKTTNLPSDPADQSLIITATDAVMARLGAPAGASVSADIASVKAQTAEIETDTQDIQGRLPAALVSGRMDASVGAMAANVVTAAALAADAGTEIAAAVGGRTITELVSVPGASPTADQAEALLYMAVRNKRDTTASADEIHNDAGAVIATAALSDDGTTFTKGEFV